MRVDKKVQHVEVDWISDELRAVLKEHNIELCAEESDSTCAMMFTCKNAATGNPVICFIVNDIIGAGLTYTEGETIIWHEVAHIIHDATEAEADDFAIKHTSYEAWKSSVIKTDKYLGKQPSGEYAHRIVVNN